MPCSTEYAETSPDVDGNFLEPIAICGFSVKFPQDASSAEDFWRMMVERRCAMTRFPSDRLNSRGFYSKSKTRNSASLASIVSLNLL